MDDAFASLRSRINDKTASVGIIGLGYVGLPLARAFVDGGFPVLGFDVDPAKVERLRRGESYIGHIPADAVRDDARAAASRPPTASTASTSPTPSSSACRRR